MSIRMRPVRLAVYLFIAASLAVAVRPARAFQAGAPEDEVRTALKAYLISFEELDWPAFKKHFAPNATMFHPAAPNERRIDSQKEFDAAWMSVFERIRRNSGRTTPPYHKLEPQ